MRQDGAKEKHCRAVPTSDVATAASCSFALIGKLLSEEKGSCSLARIGDSVSEMRRKTRGSTAHAREALRRDVVGGECRASGDAHDREVVRERECRTCSTQSLRAERA